jgi:FMN phosphatase YigB (HAD superfamily)
MVACSGSHRSALKHEKSMINNIIFDLGNVLLSWKPEEYLIKNGYDADLRATILNDVFKSPVWLQLDNGDIGLEEAVRTISLKSTLKTKEISDVFNLRTKIIFPLTCNTKLLPALKKQGFRLYYLSNFPDDIFDEVHMKYNFFTFFDGGLISARVNASKPDEKIFRILMKQFSLQPEKSLFIDDSETNTFAAKMTGMKVIHLKDFNELQGKLEKELGINLGL